MIKTPKELLIKPCQWCTHMKKIIYWKEVETERCLKFSYRNFFTFKLYT